MPISTLDHIGNAWSSAIAAGCCVLYLGNMTNHLYCTPLTVIAVPYFAFDCFKCNWVHAIHHICSLSLIYTTRMGPYPVVSLFMYKMELSTLLYNGLPYVPRRAKNPLLLVFAATFTKVRIVDYYFFLKNTNTNWELGIPLYVLFAINVYWYVLMLSKMRKIVIPDF